MHEEQSLTKLRISSVTVQAENKQKGSGMHNQGVAREGRCPVLFVGDEIEVGGTVLTFLGALTVCCALQINYLILNNSPIRQMGKQHHPSPFCRTPLPTPFLGLEGHLRCSGGEPTLESLLP